MSIWFDDTGVEISGYKSKRLDGPSVQILANLGVGTFGQSRYIIFFWYLWCINVWIYQVLKCLHIDRGVEMFWEWKKILTDTSYLNSPSDYDWSQEWSPHEKNKCV